MKENQLDATVVYIYCSSYNKYIQQLHQVGFLSYINYIKLQIIKTFKIITVAATCFGLHKPSSGSHSTCLAKITLLVQVYLLTYSMEQGPS
jgi:hypothetical protein